MKPLLFMLSVLLLAGCSSTPEMKSSFNGNSYMSAPTSINDPRLHSSLYYMDDDHSPAEQAYMQLDHSNR